VWPPGANMILCKTIHFQVKDSMASDLLASNWGLFISFFDVKCHPDLLHLFSDSVTPESVSILFVKDMRQPHRRHLGHASQTCGVCRANDGIPTIVEFSSLDNKSSRHLIALLEG
jgi:hypothetical protein